MKKGGILLCGLDNGLSYIFDEEGTTVKYKLPFNPLIDPKVYEDSIKTIGGLLLLILWKNRLADN